MSAPPRSINLLPPSEFELSFWGKFLKWGVNAGRYILIVTEMVVIAAFLSEFKLNDELDNLSQTLQGQKNILQSMAPVEDEYRQVAARLSAANTMLKAQMGAGQILDKLVGTVPAEVKLTSVIIDMKGVTLDATTTSEQALGGMLVQLAAQQQWKDVKVTDLVTDSGAVIKFSLALEK